MEKPKAFVHLSFTSEFYAGLLHVGRLRIPLSVVYSFVVAVVLGLIAYGVYGLFTLPGDPDPYYASGYAPNWSNFIYLAFLVGAAVAVYVVLLIIQYIAWVVERFRTAQRTDVGA